MWWWWGWIDKEKSVCSHICVGPRVISTQTSKCSFVLLAWCLSLVNNSHFAHQIHFATASQLTRLLYCFDDHKLDDIAGCLGIVLIVAPRHQLL